MGGWLDWIMAPRMTYSGCGAGRQVGRCRTQSSRDNLKCVWGWEGGGRV